MNYFCRDVISLDYYYQSGYYSVREVVLASVKTDNKEKRKRRDRCGWSHDLQYTLHMTQS